MEAHNHWRGLSQTEREREYSPSSCVGGDISEFLEAYATLSQRAHDQITKAGRSVTELRYGQAGSQTIDLVTPRITASSAQATVPSPLLVFIHGGYWQQLSKVESFFAAYDSLEHGVAFAAVDYTLAPDASLDEIVAECRAAMQTLLETADEHHIDPDRIVVAGSSAGAHLAAMIGLGIGADSAWRPAAVGLISGIFELEPLIGTSINDAVQLDLEAAQRNSPMLADLVDFPRALVAFGVNETHEFKRQSTELVSRLSASGQMARLVEIESRNHFDIVLDLFDQSTELGQLMYELVASSSIDN